MSVRNSSQSDSPSADEMDLLQDAAVSWWHSQRDVITGHITVWQSEARLVLATAAGIIFGIMFSAGLILTGWVTTMFGIYGYIANDLSQRSVVTLSVLALVNIAGGLLLGRYSLAAARRLQFHTSTDSAAAEEATDLVPGGAH